MNASIFDSALSHTRRSNASEKREEKSVVALRSLLNVNACGQVSSPRQYRLSSINTKNILRSDRGLRNLCFKFKKLFIVKIRMMIF